MQNDTSKFVVNIIPLQNVNTNVGGTNATNILSNNIVAIQQMVNTSNNTIRTNTIQSFTSNTSVNFISPINLSNIGITSNGSPYTTHGSMSSITTSSITTSSITGVSGAFEIVYAQQFVTLSDILAKTSIREWRSPVLSDLAKLHPYIFNYEGVPSQDIGLMAQEVGAVWPELVKDGVKKYINYDGMVALLLKGIQELGARISTLEASPLR
jgi:hypothetical protein